MLIAHLNLTVVLIIAIVAILVIFPGVIKLARAWGKGKVKQLEAENPALAYDPQIEKLRALYDKVANDSALLQGLMVELEKESEQLQKELPGLKQRAKYAKDKGDMATAEVLATKYMTMDARLKKIIGEDGQGGELEQARKDAETARQHEQDVKIQIAKLEAERDEAVKDARRLATREEIYNKLSTTRTDSIETELKHVTESMNERKARVEGKARQYENSAEVRERRIEQSFEQDQAKSFLDSL